MLNDTADAVAIWKKRHDTALHGFQAKHIYVTRLEIQVEEIEKQISKLDGISKRLFAVEVALAKTKAAKAGAGRKKQATEAKAAKAAKAEAVAA